MSTQNIARNENVAQGILDTFLFEDQKINFKREHIERTYEAFQYIAENYNTYQNITVAALTKIYKKIEEQLKQQSPNPIIVRLVFSIFDFELYYLEIKPYEKIKSPVELELRLCTHRQAPQLTQHKWFDRQYWNEHLLKIQQSSADVLIFTQNQELVETSRFNLFLYNQAEQVVYTPPLTSGCLNGVFRRFCLKQKLIHLPEVGPTPLFEKKIFVQDLKLNQLFVANSVRSLLTTKLV